MSHNPFEEIDNRLKTIEQLIKELLTHYNNEAQPNTDCWFDLNGLRNYLPDKPIKSTVYGWVHLGLIPHHKGQKKLRFLKSEIDEWLKSNEQKTVAKIAAEVRSYMVTPRKKEVRHV